MTSVSYTSSAAPPSTDRIVGGRMWIRGSKADCRRSARAGVAGKRRINKLDYETLAAFRYALRRFLRFTEDGARAAGLTPHQHQLLLAIKGRPGREWAWGRAIARRERSARR